jgi:hypothetical protein
MIRKGHPIPEELKPLARSTYDRFLSQVLPPSAASQIQGMFGRISSDWMSMNVRQRLQAFNGLHDELFADFFPKAECRTTFGRVRFTASFHSDDWSIRFSENYFQNPFQRVFKTWLHESYHAFLHFLSLRARFSEAAGVIKVPPQVRQIAQQYPLADTQANSPAILLAEKNLLGMMDRSMTYQKQGWGLDSYYLNVEIVVETLCEITFKRLLPGVPYRRSYRSAEEYIRRRQQGLPPVEAY